MDRRSFFKWAALGVAAVATPAITKVEAEAAAEIKPPAPLMGKRAYVTTVKGSKATVRHLLRSPVVYAIARGMDGRLRCPNVTPIDNNTVELRFEEPWSFTGRKIYKVVISA